MNAQGIYKEFSGLFWMVLYGSILSITMFSALNYGAGNIEWIKKAVRIAMGLLLAFTLAYGLLLFIWGGKQIGWYFTKTDDVIESGIMIFRALVPMYFIYVLYEMLSGVLRGTGNALISAVMACIGLIVFRAALQLAVINPKSLTIPALYTGYVLTWCLAAIAMLVYYLFFSPFKINRKVES